jgi:hypothetical protein
MRRRLVRSGVVVSLFLGLAPASGAAQQRPRRRTPTAAASTVVAAPHAATAPPSVAAAAPAATTPPTPSAPSASPDAVAPTSAGPEPQSPYTRGYISLAFRGGYAAIGAGEANFLGGRLGGSVGYTFAGSARFSIGVEVIYHLGFSTETASPGYPTVTIGNSGVYAGGTIGVGLGGETVFVRPFALVGAQFATSVCSLCYATPPERSATYPVFGGGLGLHFQTSVVFFGVEGRVMAVTPESGDTKTAAAVDGLIGVRIR